MLSYTEDSDSGIIKKYTLNYLINHIDNIDEDFLKGLHLIIFMDDRFKAKLLALLKETRKQVNSINHGIL